MNGGSRRAAVGTAIRFAVGHALMLGLLALVCLLAGIGISETFERWAEIFGGAVLLALALAALFFPHVLRHGHPHLPGHGDSHVHPPADRSARVSTATGALMAISGTRSLLLALPPLVVGGAFSLQAWAYLPGFALGVLVSMSAFGLVAAEGLSRGGERLHKLVALSTAGVAAAWIVVRL